ncbi:MAG TPA: hypothetical protein VF683_09880 [Chthoniobacterales bacterium]|jgi:hypothetical protein
MKATILAKALVLAVGVSAFLSATAGADPNNRRTEKTLVQDSQERYVRVTGSNIPQKVQLRSIGTTTPYNLRIYTRRELESRGTGTVAGGLALDPSIRISGNY